MAPTLKSLVLLIAIVEIASMSRGGKAGLLAPKTTVEITNGLPNHEDMTLHCKDKHHDLGEQTLKFGETYEFTFRPNPISKVTLYFCRFWSQSMSPRYFDIYKQDRDQCTVCAWKINGNGPCLFGVCYPWNPPQYLYP